MPTESATNGGIPPVHCAISCAVGIGEPDREVVVLVDVGAERRALDVGVDLVGDRDEAVPDHLERDRIDGERGAVVVGDVLHGRLYWAFLQACTVPTYTHSRLVFVTSDLTGARDSPREPAYRSMVSRPFALEPGADGPSPGVQYRTAHCFRCG